MFNNTIYIFSQINKNILQADVGFFSRINIKVIRNNIKTVTLSSHLCICTTSNKGTKHIKKHYYHIKEKHDMHFNETKILSKTCLKAIFVISHYTDQYLNVKLNTFTSLNILIGYIVPPPLLPDRCTELGTNRGHMPY